MRGDGFIFDNISKFFTEGTLLVKKTCQIHAFEERINVFAIFFGISGERVDTSTNIFLCEKR